MSKPEIIIMDNNGTFRQSLKHLLAAENIARIIGEASDSMEFMDILTKNNPDLVLMGISLDPKNGTEIMKKALQYMPDLKIIVLSMFMEEVYHKAMIELGVKGFLQKSSHLEEFEKAINVVSKGENYFFQQKTFLKPELIPVQTVSKFKLN